MSKHTPGTWMVTKGLGSRAYLVVCTESCQRIDVASTYTASAESVANARLIAAAPELLAQLENILRAYGSEHESHSFNQWPEVIEARAAIAKATGADK